MPTRREMLATSAGLLLTTGASAADPVKSRMGIVVNSYPIRRAASKGEKNDPPFESPLGFLRHCRQVGAAGVQTGLGTLGPEEAVIFRKELEQTEMFAEGIVRLPSDKSDLERFENELRRSKEAGATIIRTVCLNSRRYETFATAGDFEKFSKDAEVRVNLAEPVARKLKVFLAIENHKDWRADQLVDLVKKISSEYVRICLDTGNNIALLDDALDAVRRLAPLSITTHFKDMAVADDPEGFLLAEVPLGTGYLDLKKMVEIIRAAQPRIRFNLEMITRDPLKVPCLTPKYWATFDTLPGKHLAETLASVRKHAPMKKLPTVSNLPREQQVKVEEENVRQCLTFANEHLDLKLGS